VLRWGLTRRCPRCGAGHLFRHWFTLVPDCPRCHLHFEREEGYWAGALAVNVGLTFGLFAVVFVALVAATVPEVPVAPLLAVLVPIVVVTPIVAYPFSKTIWMALDHAFLLRMDPGGGTRGGISRPGRP
jgi:uncharacterized protein (DUF983 family)